MEVKDIYQEYIDWGEDRYKIVEEIKHQEPSDASWIKISYPEQDFIQLFGQQDKKAIKIKTYRYKAIAQFQKPKAIIVFFHNIGMTGQVSGHFAEDMAKKGFETVTMDLRGHGLSEGEKGYFEAYETVMKDVQNFVKKVRQLYPGVPIFALGDGVGCLVMTNFFRDNKKLPFKGVIYAGPSFGRPQRSKVLSKISQFSLKIMPNRTGIFAMNYQNFSRNPNVTKLFKQGKQTKLFYHDKICVGSLSTLSVMTKEMDEKTFKKLHIPVDMLLIQGQNDKSSDAFHTIRFYEEIQCKKQLLYYKKMWHMFLFEKQYPQIRDKIEEWITKRI